MEQHKVDAHGAQFRVVTITPELAKKILDEPSYQPAVVNIRNRNINYRVVNRYVATMKAGQWQVNGEPIVFAACGARLNGEHRLRAIMEAGVPITTAVVTGINPAAFTTIDAGHSRSGANVLTISGHSDAKTLHAVAAAVMHYDRGMLSLTKRTSAFASNDELLSYVGNSMPLIIEACDAGRAINKSINGIGPAIAGSCYFLSRQSTINAEVVERFWRNLRETIAGGATEPVAVLIRTVNNARSSKHILSRPWTMAVLIKAFNAFAEHKNVPFLKWANDERFPAILGRPPRYVDNQAGD
jgi:hypothetical protein